MMSKISSRPLSPFIRSYGNCKEEKKFNVAVCGAAGGIGQPLSLLLKLNPLVGELRLFDIKGTPGVGADLSHIESPANVKHFNGPEQLKESLCGADVIVVSAGVPRKPEKTREKMMVDNADVIISIAEAAAAVAPEALFAIVTNPVNSLVPLACEVFKSHGRLDPNRVFGVTTIDVVRTSTFAARAACLDPRHVIIPVIGGHSGETIIPLFSQSQPMICLEQKELEAMITKIRDAWLEIVAAKGGKSSSTVATAYSTAAFTTSLLLGLKGEPSIVECAYVKSNVTEVEYFASPLLLGRRGVEKHLALGKLSPYEEEMFKKAIPLLRQYIQVGHDYFKKYQNRHKKCKCLPCKCMHVIKHHCETCNCHDCKCINKGKEKVKDKGKDKCKDKGKDKGKGKDKQENKLLQMCISIVNNNKNNNNNSKNDCEK